MIISDHPGSWRREHNLGAVGAAPFGTSVTTGGTTATKGTPAELITSTAFDAWMVSVIVSQYAASTVASDGALDILIGAATEEILIPDLLFGAAGGETVNAGLGPRVWTFPLHVPAGSRLAAQAAGRRTSTALRVGIVLHGGPSQPPFRCGTRVDTLGMGTVPNGTAITAGETGAEGGWTQIIASTARDYFALVPSLQVTNDGSTNFRTLFADIGIGAATEEEVLQSQIYMTDNTERMVEVASLPHFATVPAGSRLTMRVSNSGLNDAGYDGVIHGVC